MTIYSNKYGTISITRILVTIVTLLCLLVGTCTLVRESCKIVGAGTKLMVLYENALFYNGSYIKTDQMTENYLANQAEREKYYNSQDDVIRVYSNWPCLIKLMVWFLAILAIPAVPFMVFIYIARQAYAIKRKMDRQRRKIEQTKKHPVRRRKSTFCKSA